ncbi:hypothetical protein PENTCL1PPCAC_3894, partial [Pristionchus entomophagus]
NFSYSRNILFAPAARNNASDFVHNYFHEKYNSSVEDGFIVVEYWQKGRLNITSIFYLLSVISRFLVELIFCVVLARRTQLGIAESTSISESHRTMQLKFLQTIVAQMFVPVISVYTPLLILLLSPLLGSPSPSLSSLFPFLASCYPVWDAVAVILLIRDYREGVFTILTGKTVRRNEVSGYSTRGTGAFTSRRTRSAAAALKSPQQNNSSS